MGSSVKFMITSAERSVLVNELGYSPEEVDVMRPDIAAQLVEKRTKRPFGTREMPEAWKRGGTPPGRNGSGVGGLLSNNLVKLFLVGVAMIWGAVATGRLELGTLLGGAQLGRKPLTKLSDKVVKPKKKRSKKLKKSKRRTVA